MTENSHMIIGLPRSGKTTFLAALWHLVTAGQVPTKLTLDRLGDDSEHLNAIAEKWRRGEEILHTSLQNEKSVVIHLKESDTNRSVTLEFPDLDGETFNRQVEKRLCRQSYIDSIDSENGILLIITANRKIENPSLVSLARTFTDESNAERSGILENGNRETENSEVNRNVQEKVISNPPEKGATSLQDWSSKEIPEQDRIFELLQFLLKPPFKKCQRRVAVVISAWDVLEPQGLEPHSWLKKNLPLVHQSLICNSDSFEFRTYGVSAQGDEYTDEGKKRLLGMKASERIICVGPDVLEHDLTSPILWLMGET